MNTIIAFFFRGLFSIFEEEQVKPLPLDPTICSPALVNKVYEVANRICLEVIKKGKMVLVS